MLAIRVPLAIASGLFLSFAVFLGLWHLIGAPLEVGSPVKAAVVEFSRLIPDTPAENKRAEKPTRKPPPPTPQRGRFDGRGEQRVSDGLIFERIVAPIARGDGLPVAGTDRDTVPIVRVPPQYPPAAAERGIEGWVRVQFSVTAVGSVRDVAVVDSEPGTIFDDAALAAVARWRYNPRIDGGVAVERVGLETLLRFRLDD
jgi:protein TonB